MIELNHFGTTASSALFDWNADKQVMYNGPFEFRVSKQNSIQLFVSLDLFLYFYVFDSSRY